MLTAKSQSNDGKRPFNQKRRFWLAILIIAAGLSFYQYRHASTYANAQNKTQTLVVAAPVTTSDIPVYISALGSVTPRYTVTVRSQINGLLMRVLFVEGQNVKQGDLLAEIDSRPYEAALTQNEGQLQRDSAQLANAKIDLKRYKTLWNQDSVAQQTLATQAALVQQLEGTVKLDEGLVAATKVNLIYCKIISPIDGRIGLRLVDPGNLVQTSDTNGIAVVTMLSPITVIFSIAEDYIPEVMQKLNNNQTLTVQAFDRQQNRLLATGQLLTANNQVDTSTGTVSLRAQFENTDNALFPNQFVNVRLLVKTLLNAVVVPTAAIQNTAKGNLVYVLSADQKTVIATPVVTGITTDTVTTINSGLTPGQSVIVEGTDKLTNGATVKLAAVQPLTQRGTA
jgi:multidrug efflux system membrane fusion protein